MLAATLARLAAAHDGVALVAALKDATGLDLRDAIQVVGKFQSGQSFMHVTAARLDLIKRARAEKSAGDASSWIDRFVEAALDDQPWLAGVPGPATGVYFWRRERPPASAEWWVKQLAFPATPEDREALRLRLEAEPELNGECPSWFGGEASFDTCRESLRNLLAGSAFWSAHVQMVRDEPAVVSCRFTLDVTGGSR